MVSHDQHDELVSPAQTAELLGCSRATIYRRLHDGRLRGLKSGTTPQSPWRIPASRLAELLTRPNPRGER